MVVLSMVAAVLDRGFMATIAVCGMAVLLLRCVAPNATPDNSSEN